jgi:hypothetical protein
MSTGGGTSTAVLPDRGVALASGNRTWNTLMCMCDGEEVYGCWESNGPREDTNREDRKGKWKGKQ